MKTVLIAMAMILAAPPTLAQEADGPDLVDALVVNARTPGPAWWGVGKGSAKVWVLGVGVPVPADAKWDGKAFERRVKASRRIITLLPSKAKFEKGTLDADRNWVDELTEAERARLAEIAAATRRPTEMYAKLRPNLAGLIIASELESRAKPKAGKSQDLAAKAQRLGARPIPVGGQEAQSMKASFQRGGHDSLTCVRWAMRPRDPAALREQRAQAWMRGDVRALLIGPATYDPCVQAMTAMQSSLENTESQMADTIAATLERGEGAVALVGLIPLLRQDGVLDQLRKRGYRVETPAQLDDED
ncbi:TraB/GumN family protein [Caulobacter sp. 1776]|uniref:TraB/GumN family protein n=1 Tax=Caulobacter sp. 1776 TaxID=3156420 RepID=UPI0033994BFB